MKRLHKGGVMAALAGALLAALSATPAAADATYQVRIDTSAVKGTSGFLDFQFNPGNSSGQAATATIAGFASDGALTNATLQTNGDVTGTLPGTLTFDNLTALNEYFQSFNFGTTIAFSVTLGGPAINAPNGTATAGSTFGVGLYDQNQNPILTNQGAFTGFAGLIDINLNGTTTVTAFPTATNGPSVFKTAGPAKDAFQIRYTANLDKGDSFVNLTNTGALSNVDPVGNICVNVYTFDPAEELISCCSCVVTPNGLQSLSVLKSLISNPLTPAIPTAAVIKMVASTANNKGSVTCNPSLVNEGNLVPGLLAWGTGLHAQPTTPVSYGVTEGPFSQAALSAAELAHITSTCGFIQSNGSGFGICKGCAAGGRGATPAQ